MMIKDKVHFNLHVYIYMSYSTFILLFFKKAQHKDLMFPGVPEQKSWSQMTLYSYVQEMKNCGTLDSKPQQMSNAMVMLNVGDMLPFSIVESEHFRDLSKLLIPSIICLGRKQVQEANMP